MKLLFITRKVDAQDSRAGFVHQWLREFAGHVSELHVVCLERGSTEGLPGNCTVYSLGRENGRKRLREFIRFHYLAFKLVPLCDGVFAHQNPEYGILVSPWSRLFGRKLVAWYTHKAVTLKLRILALCADELVTASQESFRLSTKKLHIMHHGIDSDFFSFSRPQGDTRIKLLTVGRFSKTKNIHVMIEAMSLLVNEKKIAARLIIAGAPVTKDDELYEHEIRQFVTEHGLESYIRILGAIPYPETPALYAAADIFVNLSQTGSLDKAVLEAMSTGCLIATGNEAFKSIVPSEMYIEDSPVAHRTAEVIATLHAFDLRERDALSHAMREIVVSRHTLGALVAKIIALYRREA